MVIKNKRLLFIGFVINLYFIFVSVILFNKINHHEVEKNIIAKKEIAIRPKIYDRNYNLLATTISTRSLYANPKKIQNPGYIAKTLSEFFKEDTYEYFYQKLTSKKHFVWIKKHILPKELESFLNLKIPEIYWQKDYKRIYPSGNLFSHLIGYVSTDNVGIAGFEHHIEKLEITEEVQLTVDQNIQYILTEEIKKVIESYNALGGAGIILNAKNGQILALTSQPDFNLNSPQNANREQKFNRATLGLYEYGSIMKVFTLAAALDTNTINLEDEFDVSEPIKMHKFLIKDFHKPKKPIYSVSDIIEKSSNVGMAKIAFLLGNQNQYEYFKRMNLFNKLNIEIPEKSFAKINPNYKELKMATISYGYGFITSLLHIAQGFAAILNGGYFAPATILKKDNTEYIKVLNEETSAIIRDLTRNVTKTGTGRRAEIKEYEICSKTGSAEKSIKGVYNKKLNVSSFVAGFPKKDIQYIITIMIDEPKSTGFVTGGIVVAPAIKNIVERISPILNIHPVHEY